jgi:co-chaperonin GroES (HSP10)
MKILIRLSVLFLTLSFSGNIVAEDYKEYAQEIRNEVWAWDNPEFKNYTLPDEYKNESAVILAHREEISAVSKKRLRYNFMMGPSINRELYFTDIDRVMVKINDKVALEKYSEISFKEEDKIRGVMRSNTFRSVIGIRIIKPDGSIQDINVDDEAVAVTEGKKDKEEYRKLAVPGLQVGDIIDYFFCDRMELETKNVGIQRFPFYAEYPILSYSVHCEISKKLTVEYATMNGAPDFVRSTDDDNDFVLDVVKTNIPKTEASRWTSFYRDLPVIRMAILNNGSKLIYKPGSARKAGIYKRGDNLDTFAIVDDAWNNSLVPIPFNYPVINKIKKVIKEYQNQHPDITQEELADYIYDACHFYTWLEDIYSHNFHRILSTLLKDFKIPQEDMWVTYKYGARMSDIVTAYDLEHYIKVNNRYYFYPYSLYQTPYMLHPSYQGEDGYITSATTLIKNKIKNKEVTEKNIILPQTTSEENKALSVMKVTLSADDSSLLIIDRQEERSGSLKEDMQALLGSYEVWDKTMRKRLQVTKTLEEEMQENKRERKYIDEMKTRFEQRRKEQKDSVKVEIDRFHGIEPKDVSTYELSALGITPDAPNMLYSATYSLDGLVKKAGKNLILDAGKLIGAQWIPDASDRARTINVYLPTPRMYAQEIEIQIPENYKVQGLEKLNTGIENEYASFRATATLEGSVLKIHAEKNYRSAFIPVAEWKKLIAMLEKANEFYSQSVVLSPL